VLLLTDFLDLRKGSVSDPDELTAQFRSWIEMEIHRYNPVALKIDSAFRRGLHFPEPNAKEVARGLSELGEDDPFSSHRGVNDYVHELAAEWASRHALPVQIHTGMLSGNTYRQQMDEIYAHRLESYIARHPETAFDIFHLGFPQWEEGMVLARRYPNVYVNLCWLTSISESLTHTILETVLEAVPLNKILWGGGTQSPEMAYGVLTLFRSILERVLYIKDIPDEPKEEIADKLLWKNASKLYHLS
jgi:predicted TIM-barrel fold metal-dependent hydrolase